MFLSSNNSSKKEQFIQCVPDSRIFYMAYVYKDTQLIEKEEKTIYGWILYENNEKLMLAAFSPRVGHTQTYNIILRTKLEKLALHNNVTHQRHVTPTTR